MKLSKKVFGRVLGSTGRPVSFLLALWFCVVPLSVTTHAAPIKSLILGDFQQLQLTRNQAGDDARFDLIRQEVLGFDARFDVLASQSLNLAYHPLPDLAFLQQFDSVLAFTDHPYQYSTYGFPIDLTALSNVLGSFVNSGGGVVLATFWGQDDSGGVVQIPGGIGGTINSPGYNPLVNPRFFAHGDAPHTEAMVIDNSGDPIVDGVSSIESSQYYGDYSAGLDVGATMAAHWSDNTPAVAYNSLKNVATISLNPNVPNFGNVTPGGDWARLFANALVMTGESKAGAPHTAVPEPSSILLLLGGIGGLTALRRRK